MDSDDGEGSRGVPSRSRIGKKASVIEKFPALGAPLSLFFGFVTIPLWGFRRLSIAMTDIMVADLPHVLYNVKEVITDEEVSKANEMQAEIKKKRESGFNLASKYSLDNEVDANKFVESKIK